MLMEKQKKWKITKDYRSIYNLRPQHYFWIDHLIEKHFTFLSTNKNYELHPQILQK